MLKCFFTILVLSFLQSCCLADNQQLIHIFRASGGGDNGTLHCGTVIRCKDSSILEENFALYLVIDYLPVLLIFPLVIFFNLNLASGPKHSLLFFYQCVPVAIAFDYHPTRVYLYSGEVVWGFFTLHNNLNIIYNHQDNNNIYSLPYLETGMLKLLLAMILVIVIIAVVRCASCPIQRCRYPWAMCRRSARKLRGRVTSHGSILRGVCSLLLIIYGYAVQQSFSALQWQIPECCHTDNGTMLAICPRFCEDITYFSLEHLPYFVPPVVVLLLFLPIPLILIYYSAIPALVQHLTKVPIPRFRRLVPVFDNLQSVYKNKFRFFSGLQMLYLYLVWGTFALVPDRPVRGYVVSAEFMILLLVHSLCQPFKEPKHNYFHTLFLINLVAISTTTSTMVFLLTYDATRESSGLHNVFFALMIALTLLPLLCIVPYYVKLWGSRCIQCYKKKMASAQAWSDNIRANQHAEDGSYYTLEESLVTTDSEVSTKSNTDNVVLIAP